MKQRKRFLAVVLAMLMVFAMIPAGSAGKVSAASGGTITMSVEKFSLGQGYLIEPEQVAFTEGENIAQVFDRLMKKHGYTYSSGGSLTSGFYLRSIDKADTGNLNIPKCIQSMPSTSIDPPTNTKNSGNDNFPALGEYAYSNQGGWYYFVNEVAPNYGCSDIKAVNGDVVRIQFTVYGYGADIGAESSPNALTLPNRTDITKKLAVVNGKKTEAFKNPTWKTAYENAVKVASNLDSTAAQITAAAAGLPTASQIDTWTKQEEQKAKDQAAANSVISKIKAIGTVNLTKESKIKAARKAYNALTATQKKYVTNVKTLTNAEKTLSLFKKYTPKKATLKSVKKSGTGKMKLTWGRVTSASGYQIYMSNKKSSGYKKIATITKNKTVTYTKTKLKKGKTYYFKIRTYRKAGSKTYYGSYSNIRYMKMK